MDNLETQIANLAKQLDAHAEVVRNRTLKRFPFLFLGLGSFGIVAVLYAFERIIDTIPFLANRPWAILAFGVGILILTGQLYRRLS